MKKRMISYFICTALLAASPGQAVLAGILESDGRQTENGKEAEPSLQQEAERKHARGEPVRQADPKEEAAEENSEEEKEAADEQEKESAKTTDPKGEFAEGDSTAEKKAEDEQPEESADQEHEEVEAAEEVPEGKKESEGERLKESAEQEKPEAESPEEVSAKEKEADIFERLNLQEAEEESVMPEEGTQSDTSPKERCETEETEGGIRAETPEAVLPEQTKQPHIGQTSLSHLTTYYQTTYLPDRSISQNLPAPSPSIIFKPAIHPIVCPETEISLTEQSEGDITSMPSSPEQTASDSADTASNAEQNSTQNPIETSEMSVDSPNESPETEIYADHIQKSEQHTEFSEETPEQTESEAFEYIWESPKEREVTETSAAEPYESRTEQPEEALPPLLIQNLRSFSANRTAVVPSVSVAKEEHGKNLVNITLQTPQGTSVPLSCIQEDAGDYMRYQIPEITEDGQYALKVERIDESGNSVSEKMVFSVNRQGTKFIYNEEKSEISARERYVPEVYLENVDEIAVVSCTVNGQEAAYEMDGAILRIPEEELAEGRNEITLSVRDAAGNVSRMEPWEIFRSTAKEEQNMENDDSIGAFRRTVRLYPEALRRILRTAR